MNGLKLKRIVACLLVLLLVANVGISAFAESYEGSKVRIEQEQSGNNPQLMRFLEDEYGTEQAASMYRTIQNLGLVDSSGRYLNHPIDLNGKEYTLDEMKPIIADPGRDLTQFVEIDGERISLDTLKKIIGIEEQLEALRQTIDPGEVYSTKQKSGQNFGLGMFHIKKIMDAHHGKVKVTSQPGKGTVVTLVFPLEQHI